MNTELFLNRLAALCTTMHRSPQGIQGVKAPTMSTVCSHPTCSRCSFKHSEFCGTHINHSSLKNLFRELILYRPNEYLTTKELQRKLRVIVCLVHRYQNEVPHHELENVIECMIHYQKWVRIPSVCSHRPSPIISNPYTIYSRRLRNLTSSNSTTYIGIKLTSTEVGECPICNDEHAQLGKLPKCTHHLCQGCWSSWEKQGHTTCPMCREEQV